MFDDEVGGVCADGVVCEVVDEVDGGFADFADLELGFSEEFEEEFISGFAPGFDASFLAAPCANSSTLLFRTLSACAGTLCHLRFAFEASSSSCFQRSRLVFFFQFFVIVLRTRLESV